VESVATQQVSISLPVSIVSPTDIARLTREIEGVENFFRDQSIRNPGAPITMPRLSKLMDQLAADNQLNLLNDSDRSKILELLEKLHESAPVMHISFSVDPPGVYVQKIVAWLRQNIHQHILVTVGLQPNIGAGCVVRTTNRLFDFSLREYFTQKRDFFIEKLHEAISDEGQVAVKVAGSEDETSIPVAQASSQESQATTVPIAQPETTVQHEPIQSVVEIPTELTAPIPAPLPAQPRNRDQAA
jgi:hypothetical protein